MTERLPCLGTLVEGSDALRRLLLPPRERVNFDVNRRVVDRDTRAAAMASRSRSARTSRSARGRTSAQPFEELCTVRPLGDADVVRGEQRVAATVDQRGRDLEAVSRDQLLEQRVLYCGICSGGRLRLQVGLDLRPQILQRLGATVVPRELVVERRRLLALQVDDLDVSKRTVFPASAGFPYSAGYGTSSVRRAPLVLSDELALERLRSSPPASTAHRRAASARRRRRASQR